VFQILSGEEDEKQLGFSSDADPEGTDIVFSSSKAGAPILRHPKWFIIVEVGDGWCKCLWVSNAPESLRYQN